VESWRSLPTENRTHVPAQARVASPPARRLGRAVRTDAKMAALLALPPLRGASDRELALMAHAGEQVDLAAETTIVEAGERVEWIHLLVEGSAFSVTRSWRFGPGDCIGAAEYLAGEPGLMTVMAGSDVRMLTLGANQFTALLDTAQCFRRAVVTSLARQLSQSLQHHDSHHPGCEGRAVPRAS
jgi:CRP-like cAMP-binding protein